MEISMTASEETGLGEFVTDKDIWKPKRDQYVTYLTRSFNRFPELGMKVIQRKQMLLILQRTGSYREP